MVTSAFAYHAPTSVAEAARLLAEHGDEAKLLAGGHSLIPLMKLRLSEPSVLIDLGKVEGMAYIREADGGGLAIGSMTTYAALQSSDLVQSGAPVLANAAGQVADQQVRNMGTIGGSLAHADPAGDLPAVAVALNAELVTSSAGGHRT
ncbi:MAG: xanthine dehydrogenase family protein subunit M, partial [Chloroflexi bacterium]|nr:xanthine dehydrogenase family protein subunit M [Chloroflexota bacterium]